MAELKKNKNSFSTLDTKQFKKLINHYGFLNEQCYPICQVVYFENTQRDQNCISGTVPMSPRLERMFPSIENPQSRFRPLNQQRSASFTPFNNANQSTNYLPNNGMHPLNYASRMAEIESCLSSENIPPYHTFGATAVTSSPKKQNNISRSTINPIPFSPLPLSSSKFWNHIENNVMSPLVTDNFCFAVPSADETYIQFGESYINKSAVNDELAPGGRMAYTKNFHLEPVENSSPSMTSSSSSFSSNGALSETDNRRGKKILGQGIYKNNV